MLLRTGRAGDVNLHLVGRLLLLLQKLVKQVGYDGVVFVNVLLRHTMLIRFE